MGKGKPILGNILENDTVLWFIILFLLLFWCCGGFSVVGRYCEENDIGLDLD